MFFPCVRRGKTRVPERTSLHSFNLLWLMWAVCGGFFITNFILSNWLTILIRPVFEKPVDTAQVNWKQSSTILFPPLLFRMCLPEVLFITALALGSGSKYCQLCLTHTRCLLGECIFQVHGMSIITWPNMTCLKRRVLNSLFWLNP